MTPSEHSLITQSNLTWNLVVYYFDPLSLFWILLMHCFTSIRALFDSKFYHNFKALFNDCNNYFYPSQLYVLTFVIAQICIYYLFFSFSSVCFYSDNSSYRISILPSPPIKLRDTYAVKIFTRTFSYVWPSDTVALVAKTFNPIDAAMCLQDLSNFVMNVQPEPWISYASTYLQQVTWRYFLS